MNLSDEAIATMVSVYEADALGPFDTLERRCTAMRAALEAAAPFLGVPDGWVMVPKEPDEAMIYAAHKMAVREDILSITFKTRKLWEAMIDAALPQPTGVSEWRA